MQRYRHIRAALVLCLLGISLAALVVAGDRARAASHAAGPVAQQVTVSPAVVSYGESVEITVEGLPPRYPLPAGAVTLAGLRLPVPGYFGTTGERPESDELGNLTFTTYPPTDTPLGSQSLAIAIAPLYFASTVLEFPGAPLSLSPTSAVPNQTVLLNGTGFTPASAGGGLGPQKVHQITGRGESVITLNGDALRTPYVNYPIDLDKDGGLLTTVIIPATQATALAGILELRSTDSGGRAGSIELTIPSPTVAFHPAAGYPSETVRIRGSGLQASNPSLSFENTVNIEYQYVVNQGTPSQYYVAKPLGQATVDGSGAFDAEFTVPQEARIPSSNFVAILPRQGEPSTATHTVPGPSVTAIPGAAFNNQAVRITVKGLPHNYTLPAGAVTLSGVRMPLPGYFGVPGGRPKTDSSGKATFESLVPAPVPVGVQQLQLQLPAGEQVTNTLEVLIATLSVTPQAAVPGQTVVVSSSDLSPAAAGAPGPLGNHQINGVSLGLVTLQGRRIGSPHVTYPIDLEVDGVISFPLVVPMDDLTIGGDELAIRVADTGGRKGMGRLTIKRPTLTIRSGSGTRGSLAEVVGEGFVATAGPDSSPHRIDIDYAGERVAVAVTDTQGSFEATFRVPSATAAGSTNSVTARLRHVHMDASMEARATHVVPAPSVTVHPESGPPGAKLTVTGRGFRGFTQVLPTIDDVHQPQSTGIYTDINGSFNVSMVVPEAFPSGPSSLSVQVDRTKVSFLFEVTEN